MWTEAMTERFIEITNDKKVPYSEVAKAISVEFGVPITKNAAVGKGKRMGLPPREGVHRGRPWKRHEKRDPNNRPRTAQPFTRGMQLQALKRKLRTPSPTARRRVKPAPIGGVDIMKLKPHHCRYVITEQSPHRFCGGEKIDNSSYCSEHHAITHTGYWRR